jgi:predicted phosphodiesterase
MKRKKEVYMTKARLTDNDLSAVNTNDLLNLLKERGYFASKLPPTTSGKSFKVDLKRLKGRDYKFGVISCTQIGSKYQQMTHLHSFYKLCKKKGIELVLHCGDLVDGSKVYRGQEYELFLHGADAQKEYVVNQYPRIAGIKTKVIMGNHDESFYKTDGYNIVKAICEQRDDIEYLGDYLAFIDVDKIKLALMHGAGGVAYARSYKLQKIIEQLSPNSKPHMLFLGHYHVQAHIPAYRNVEGIMVGCFQSQTPFLTRLGLAPNIGGVLVEMHVDDSGLLSVKTEWIPYYVPVKNDY